MDNNRNGLGCGTITVIVICILLLLGSIGSCSSNSSDSSSTKYSSDYYNDKSYRENVNEVADIFGEDPSTVDSKIQAVVDAMND